MGARDAREDPYGPLREAAGGGERRTVPRLRREHVRDRHRPRGRRRDEGVVMTALAARRYATAFWVVAFAYLIVMAFATMPSPLYGLYRVRDDLSALSITVVYSIFAASTIATLLAVPRIAARIGRR